MLNRNVDYNSDSYICYKFLFHFAFQLRLIKLQRQPNGSLGISLKGGTDHNLPILISKVCRNEDDDHLYIGDAIVKGNLNYRTEILGLLIMQFYLYCIYQYFALY